MKPTTLEEALSLVPTHWPLIPGVDVWQDGDESLWKESGTPAGRPSYEWRKTDDRYFGDIVSEASMAIRRPIPQDVRGAIAHLAFCNSQPLAVCVDDLINSARVVGRWIAGGKP